MNSRKYVATLTAATLAAALLLGTAVLGSTAGQADAEPERPGPIVYCYIEYVDRSFDLYRPSDVVNTHGDGPVTCGADGTWIPVSMGQPAGNITAQ